MTDLSAFTFEGATVRVAVANGLPWFLLPDLCNALDLGVPDRVASHLVPEALCLISGTSKARPVPAVTESGAIALALRTSSLAGRRNKAWLLEEVLPAAKQLAALAQPGPRTIMATATAYDAGPSVSPVPC